MIIGLSNRVLWDFGLSEVIKAVSDLEYDAIELWAEPPHLLPAIFGKEEMEDLRQTINGYNLKSSIHATHRDLNLASFNPPIRKESIKQFLECIKLASCLESKIVVVHPGKKPSSEATSEECEKAWELMINGFKECAGAAERLSIILAVENMENPAKELVINPTDMNRLVKEVDSPNLRLTFDVSHANLHGDPSSFIREVEKSIAHVHISDNRGLGKGKTHLPLGEGSVDFISVFRELIKIDYKGMVVVEGYVPHRHSQIKAAFNNKKFLDKVLNDFWC